MFCSFWQWKIDVELKNNKEIKEEMDRVKNDVDLIGEGCGACNNMCVLTPSIMKTNSDSHIFWNKILWLWEKMGNKKKRTKVTHIYDYLCVPVQI